VCHNSDGNVESLEEQAPPGLPSSQAVSKKRRPQPQMLNSRAEPVLLAQWSGLFITLLSTKSIATVDGRFREPVRDGEVPRLFVPDRLL